MGGFSLMGNQTGGMPTDAFNRVTRGGPFARRKFTFGSVIPPQPPDEEMAGESGSFPGFLDSDWGRTDEQPAEESIPFEGPAVPTRLQRMQSDLHAMDNPEASTRQRLLNALMGALPTALGGIFGGSEGAMGAAAGTNEFLDRERAEETYRRKNLLEEMESERDRQNRLEQARIGAESRENVAGMNDAFRRQQDAWKQQNAEQTLAFKQQQDAWKQENARQKTDAYLRDIESLMQSRTANTALGREKLKLQADELQRRIDRDADLDENAKSALGQRLLIHRENLEQQQAEEAGRNYRMQEIQTRITERAAAKGANSTTVAKNFAAAQSAAKKLNPDLDDLEPEQQAAILNTLFDAFMANEAPVVVPGKGKGSLFGVGPSSDIQGVKSGGAASSKSDPLGIR